MSLRLPRPGRCKFCRTRIPRDTCIQNALEIDDANTVQFPCPYCEMKMLAVLHSFHFIEYKGALEEEEEVINAEPPPTRERTPNVAGNDNRLREALKRSRSIKQALQSKPAPAHHLQLAYKKQ